MSYKIVGLTGPQGCGKSTLLAAIEANTSNELVIDKSTISRSVQTSLGYESLVEAYASVASMMSFQEAVLAALTTRDKKWKDDPGSGVVLVDRTPLDLMVYAMMWTMKLTSHTDPFDYAWCLNYAKRCSLAIHSHYDLIFTFSPSENIAFANEKNRAAAADVPKYMEHFDRVVYGMINRRPCRYHFADHEWQLDHRVEKVIDITNALHNMK